VRGGAVKREGGDGAFALPGGKVGASGLDGEVIVGEGLRQDETGDLPGEDGLPGPGIKNDDVTALLGGQFHSARLIGELRLVLLLPSHL